MKYIIAAVLILLVVLPFPEQSQAGSGGRNAIFEAEDASSALAARLQPLVEQIQVLRLNRVAAETVFLSKPFPVEIELPFPEKGSLRLALRPFQLLTPDARIVAGTDTGDQPLPDGLFFSSFSGVVEGEPGSLVSLSFSETGVFAFIRLPAGDFVLAPVTEGIAGQKGIHLLYPAAALKEKPDISCDNDLLEIPRRVIETIESLPLTMPSSRSSDILEVEVAVESDYDTYMQFGGSLQGASSYLLSLMTAVSAVYARDLNVRLLVPYLRVWTTANDPYDGSDSYSLLIQFRNYWNNNMQSVSRDLAHYISVRPGGLGGIAWVGVLCEDTGSGNGYAFSDVNGFFAGLPVYSWDVSVVAHETGHNFGSLHTHNCYWPGGPIDTCYVSEENDFCVTTPHPREGTIMSYCHLGSTVRLEFHPLPISVMRTNAEQAACVSISNQQLVLVSPNGGEVLYTGETVYIAWAENLGSTVDVDFSPDNGQNWQTVAAGIPANQKYTYWTVPYLPTTTTARLRIRDSANPQTADETDGPFTIKTQLWSFTPIEPAGLTTIQVAPNDPTPVSFVWTRSGSVPGIHYKLRLFSINNNRMKWNSGNGGQDTTRVLTAHQIDSLLASWQLWNGGDSVRIRWTARAYLAGDSLQANPIQQIFFKRSALSLSADRAKPLVNTPELLPNYPNPFNPETVLRFNLPRAEQIQVSIFNAVGQQVKVLAVEYLPAGENELIWDGTDGSGQPVPSGIYFYRLEGSGFSVSQKMMLLR